MKKQIILLSLLSLVSFAQAQQSTSGLISNNNHVVANLKTNLKDLESEQARIISDIKQMKTQRDRIAFLYVEGSQLMTPSEATQASLDKALALIKSLDEKIEHHEAMLLYNRKQHKDLSGRIDEVEKLVVRHRRLLRIVSEIGDENPALNRELVDSKLDIYHRIGNAADTDAIENHLVNGIRSENRGFFYKNKTKGAFGAAIVGASVLGNVISSGSLENVEID